MFEDLEGLRGVAEGGNGKWKMRTRGIGVDTTR